LTQLLSFRGARSASPESITTAEVWIPGLRQVAHPGMTAHKLHPNISK
jgi:hypothetical protein